jgi:hypothetical protein
LVRIGCVITMAPFIRGAMAVSSSGAVLPPMNTGGATISALVEADHPSA